MKTPFIVIIPARLASTRLPRKALADIGGKPMVVRVAERARLSLADQVIVATDADEIASACESHAVDVILTNKDHPTGTDRLGEVASKLNLSDDVIVVNVQGDEPLIPPDIINQVAMTLANNPECDIATAAVVITDDAEINNPNVVKIALDKRGRALYFSRAPIPYLRDASTPLSSPRCVRHIGIYAYKASFLKQFGGLEPAPIEQAEALEQLRALWHGYKIQVMITQSSPPAGVDTPDDLARVQQEWGKIGV